MNFGHFPPARADHFQRFGKTQHTGCHQGRVFAQAVPDHHIGLHTVLHQRAQHSHICGQHGRLGDGGVLQFFFRLGQFGLAAGGVNVAGQRFAQNGLHHAVGFIESGFDHRFGLAQIQQHVHVLRALP